MFGITFIRPLDVPPSARLYVLLATYVSVAGNRLSSHDSDSLRRGTDERVEVGGRIVGRGGWFTSRQRHRAGRTASWEVGIQASRVASVGTGCRAAPAPVRLIGS